ADAIQFVTRDATADRENLLAIGEGTPAVHRFDQGGKLFQLPLLAWPIELEQLIADRQRMGGEIGLRVRKVLVEVLNDVERAVHAPPVAGISANIGIDARLRGRREGELLHVARLEQSAR